MTVLMKLDNDCEVAVIANATQITYDEAMAALGRIDLPYDLESPVFANPINLYRALIKLGFWKKNITLTMLLNGECEKGSTIVLVKKSLTQQHYVTWEGIDNQGNHLLLWGQKETPVTRTPAQLKELFLTSWPNCAFQVYKASFWRLMWEKFKAFFIK